MKGRLMKQILQLIGIASFAGLLSCAPDQYARQGEYDDLYFSAKDRQKVVYEQNTRERAREEQSYQNGNNQSNQYYQQENTTISDGAGEEDGRYVDYSAYTRKESVGTATTTTGGNTYITNNYNEFSDRFDRRSDWCYSCGTGFMNVGSYYDPWGWGRSGIGFSFGYSTGWGWNSYYGYNSFYSSPYIRTGYIYAYDPFYRPYNSYFHNPYYGYSPYMDPYGYGWGSPHAAYYNGYYNGFYNGYYQRNRYTNSGSNYNTNTRPKPVNQPRTAVGSAVKRNTGTTSGGGRSATGTNSNRRSTSTPNTYNQNANTPSNYSNRGVNRGVNSGVNNQGGRGSSQPRQPSQPSQQYRTPPAHSAPSNNPSNQRSGNPSNYSGSQPRQPSAPAPTPTYRSSPSSSPSQGRPSGGSSPSRPSSAPRGGIGGGTR